MHLDQSDVVASQRPVTKRKQQQETKKKVNKEEEEETIVKKKKSKFGSLMHVLDEPRPEPVEEEDDVLKDWKVIEPKKPVVSEIPPPKEIISIDDEPMIVDEHAETNGLPEPDWDDRPDYSQIEYFTKKDEEEEVAPMIIETKEQEPILGNNNIC